MEPPAHRRLRRDGLVAVSHCSARAKFRRFPDGNYRSLSRPLRGLEDRDDIPTVRHPDVVSFPVPTGKFAARPAVIVIAAGSTDQ